MRASVVVLVVALLVGARAEERALDPCEGEVSSMANGVALGLVPVANQGRIDREPIELDRATRRAVG